METTRPEWGDWLEGYLFDRRITVVRGELSDLVATRVATELMTLDATGDEPVTLQVDSPGGSLTAAFTLIDVIDVLGVAVNIVCMGRVEGTAVAVAASGSHRLAMPHTQFRLGEPDLSFESRASEAAGLAKAQLDMIGRYHECLARSTGQSVGDIAAWCAATRYLSAAEALSLGLVDEVSKGRTPLRRIR